MRGPPVWMWLLLAGTGAGAVLARSARAGMAKGQLRILAWSRYEAEQRGADGDIACPVPGLRSPVHAAGGGGDNRSRIRPHGQRQPSTCLRRQLAQ
jgi:hypothetical protein